MFPEIFRQRLALIQQRIFKLRFSVSADVAVGVVFFRQEQKMQRFVVFQLRQRIFQRAPSRLPSRAVAVETEINTVRLTHQDFDVFRRRRRT